MVRGQSGTANGMNGGWLRSFIIGVVAFMLITGSWTAAFAAEGTASAANPAGPARAQLDEALAALQSSLGKAEPVSDWVALALARSGKPAASRYLPLAEKSASDGSLRLVTDYARVALAVNANGGNVRKFGKGNIDLLAQIANHGNMTGQGPNAPAYALMAFDAAGYTPGPGANDRWTRDALIKWLVEHRNADGGWSLSPGKSDVDVTGIVLMALAPYHDRGEAGAALDKALGWLSGVQKGNGGFGSPESSESSVQALIALTSLGIDPETDVRFVKNGKTALSRLMEFRLADGKFAHLAGGKADGMASLSAFLGLTAVERFQDGLPGLYAGNPAEATADVTVYGPKAKLAESRTSGKTVLESLLTVLKSKGVAYTVSKHPQLGPMLTAAGGTAAGSMDGYWSFAVMRAGEWVNIQEGMGTFVPQAGDKIYVYYAGADTSLIHSVKLDPASPREGQTVKVTVEKEVWDWDSGKKVIAPAEGAQVTAAGQTVATDKDGKAELQALTAGTHTVSVNGFRDGKVPLYLAAEHSIEVASYIKNVNVRVESDLGVLAQGTARGGTALEALENFLKARKVAYELKDSSYGKYLVSIGGTSSGKYGGFDGWLYAVKGAGSWIHPAQGIGELLLENGQELVVYYGDDKTRLPEIAVTPAAPKPGDTVTVSVAYRELDWNTGKLTEPKPAAGLRISAAGISADTDVNGVATLAGIKEGGYNMTVSGYADGKAAVAVRTDVPLAIVRNYGDQGKISGWAVDSVRLTRAAGVMKGTEGKNDTFSPKAAVTRAEFVSALVRSLGLMLMPVKGADYKDISAKAWYAQDIQAASKAGLIAGVSPGKFAPEAKLTREQAAMLLARALNIKAEGIMALADSGKVTAAAMASVQASLEQGWMTAWGGQFSPRQTMTREQAAVIAARILFRPGIGKLGK